jgi:riboflavin synthase alpha subunit
MLDSQSLEIIKISLNRVLLANESHTKMINDERFLNGIETLRKHILSGSMDNMDGIETLQEAAEKFAKENVSSDTLATLTAFNSPSNDEHINTNVLLGFLVGICQRARN